MFRSRLSGLQLRSANTIIGHIPRQSYSSIACEVFNRNVKRIQRNRAGANAEKSRQTDYLKDEVAFRMAERLTFISRTFQKVLDLGSGAGNLERVICDPNTPDSDLIQSRLGEITMLDSAKNMLYRDSDSQNYEFNKKMNVIRLVEDEELQEGRFAPNSFDAVVSNMSMHWINDLPGVLNRIQDILKPDGMFMCSMLGGDSLFELRTSLQLAEMERLGGMSPRVSPLADVKDMGGLMQRAKFNLLTIDVDDIIISYPNMFALISDIQAMGESNSVFIRQPMISRDVLFAANTIYKSLHGADDGSVPATFRIVYMIGWKYSADQAKPLKRGSGQVNLKEALPTYEDEANKE